MTPADLPRDLEHLLHHFCLALLDDLRAEDGQPPQALQPGQYLLCRGQTPLERRETLRLLRHHRRVGQRPHP